MNGLIIVVSSLCSSFCREEREAGFGAKEERTEDNRAEHYHNHRKLQKNDGQRTSNDENATRQQVENPFFMSLCG